MIYEYTCIRCGKRASKERTTGAKPKYCSRRCKWEANKEAERSAKIVHEAEKAKRLKELMEKKKELSPTLVNPEQCDRCKWGGKVNGTWVYCGYSDFTGHTRMGQHPEGLSSDCKEYEQRCGKRLDLRRHMGLTKEPSEIAERPRYYELDPDFERLQRKIWRYMEGEG